MSRSLLSNLRSVFSGSKPVRRPAGPAKRANVFRPSLENLEGRLVMASLALHAVGGQLQDSAGHTVVLRGVNLAGLESGIPGAGNSRDADNILQSADVALNTWHANLLRVTVNPNFWLGHDQAAHLGEAADGGAGYRNVVSQIVAKASAANAYVMLTDYEYSNNLGEPLQLRDRPTATTTSFWSDANVGAARLFANNSAVMFDPFNEPQFIGWNAWQTSMQGVLNAIRGAGANNVVSPNGMGYAHDLSGIAPGYDNLPRGHDLSDPAGNLMYQLHLYPAEWQSAADGDATIQPVAGRYPVYMGEFGVNPDGVDDGYTGVAQPSSAAWTQNMITWANQRGYSWTAWSFTPDATPVLLTDGNYTPTSYFGAVVKNALAQQAPPNPPAGPANDSFASRAAIAGAAATVSGSNANATREAGEPMIVGNGGGDSVWWTWNAPASGSATIATAGSTFDTLLGVYIGSAVSALAQVAANDDVGGGVATSTVTFNAIAGTAYQIAVDGYSGAVGNITLNVALTPAGPANNNFANRTIITGATATVSGSNTNATREAGEPTIVGNAGGRSVWWTWTAPASGSAMIASAGSSFDTLLGVYTGASVSALAQVAANDDANGGQTSSVTFNAVAGTTYQIAIDGYDGASGNITLKVALTPAGPANNNFANRTTINGAMATFAGSNVGASRETGEPMIVGNGGGHSVWWTWTASASGSTTIATAGSTFDTLLGVYTGSAVSALAQVAANDDVGGGVATSTVTFNAIAGTAYQIAVDGYSGATGNITLNVALTPAGPANNNFANRTIITGATATVSGSNTNATREAGEPTIVGNAGGHSVWWTWTAPTSGTVTITTAGSTFDTLLGVYRGSLVSALTLVASNDDVGGGVTTSSVTFSVVAGTTYQIAVDGYDGAVGNITLGLRYV